MKDYMIPKRPSNPGSGMVPLRKKYTSLAKKAERSPLSAIRLFCIQCFGGDHREIEGCTDLACPLRPFRFGYGVNDKRAGKQPQNSQDASGASGTDAEG